MQTRLKPRAPAPRTTDRATADIPDLEIAPEVQISEDERRLVEVLSGGSGRERKPRRALPLPRPAIPRRRETLAAASVLLLCLAFGWFALLDPLDIMPTETNVTRSGSSPGAALPSDSPLGPPVMPLAFVPTLRVLPPYFATGSASFDADDGRTQVQLAYLRGLDENAICADEDNLRFPCGLMGRAAMHRFLQNRPALCRPVFYARGDTRYRCFSASGDLTRLEIGVGFARPDAIGLPYYAGAQGTARRKSAGAWNGGWTLAD